MAVDTLEDVRALCRIVELQNQMIEKLAKLVRYNRPAFPSRWEELERHVAEVKAIIAARKAAGGGTDG